MVKNEFLKTAATDINGYWVVSLGGSPFCELEDDKYTLYVFPFKFHAQYYLSSIGGSFGLSFSNVEKLSHFQVDTEIIIASATPEGEPVFQDFLFPTADCVLH